MIDDELTPERIKQIEIQWKSDVDKKLDALLENQIRRGDKYDAFLDRLLTKETNAAGLRKAIIEKSVAGLVYMAIAAVCTLVWTGTKEEVRMLIETWNAAKKP